MAVQSEQRQGARPRAPALYVYGIIPADVEVDEQAHGVGGPGTVQVIRHREIAALVSETDRSTGATDDDEPAGGDAHEDLLDATAAEVPVVPLPSGTIVPDRATVLEELLKPRHDEFARALRELEGRAEYLVELRYAESGRPSEPDVRALVEALAPVSVRLSPTRPTGRRDTARLAVLAETGRAGELERALDTLAERWAGRIDLRLFGPLAPYDFTPAR
ncbi:Gas vesicle synthesis protein GvpL/GvpF [Nonomuraea coxensis DSM 45129]|uniref:Gas vesicle synthesis protein GvpL/GvpF n=1 Tax=Nonomuraea coxensis DSM 45129 TaxID=1122611 RepID=A0ABX8U5U1_9ACTN|nr:GvpL/GvpF family gas vesicle protein [Nonomuraea coxensis]QYC42474.1 Gas vesicle synthesis protein GvpL/GvpF [Nonomuraea coxensis DSM 45129]